MSESKKPKLFKHLSALICRVTDFRLDTQYVRTSFVKAVECCKGEEMIVAEIGVYEGINARHMLMTYPNIKLYLVDDWKNVVIYTGGDVQSEGYSQLVKNAALFNLAPFKNVTFTEKNSKESAKDFPDEHFDYVYIDGDHEYQAVLDDMNIWYSKVKKGGVFGGHDIGMKEVSGAVDNFVKKNNITNWDKESAPDKSDWWIFK